MIAFTIGNDGYFIDDEFNVVSGREKEKIQKDIDLFFMDFLPSDGDEVLLYKERLEEIFNAQIKDFSSVKYQIGTVDCSEYFDFGNNKTSKDTGLNPKNKTTNDSSIMSKIKSYFKK